MSLYSSEIQKCNWMWTHGNVQQETSYSDCSAIIFQNAFHKAWHSIMACVFYYYINKHKFNESCYKRNCFNLISVVWIILCAKLTHFVFTSNRLCVYRFHPREPIITERMMRQSCYVKNWHNTQAALGSKKANFTQWSLLKTFLPNKSLYNYSFV